jgi:hypothetical protein
LFVFFPWLAGGFHNLELTQNREKTRNGLIKKENIAKILNCKLIEIFKNSSKNEFLFHS